MLRTVIIKLHYSSYYQALMSFSTSVKAKLLMHASSMWEFSIGFPRGEKRDKEPSAPAPHLLQKAADQSAK